MPTVNNHKRRVNVSLIDDDIELLSFFADLSQQPLATKALEYIKKGLAADEDRYWVELAQKRKQNWQESGQNSLSFTEVWDKHIPSDSCPS